MSFFMPQNLQSTPNHHLPAAAASLSPLETAVWRTVAYSDVFDYPLTAVEIHRYLEAADVTQADVVNVLRQGKLLPQHLSQMGEYLTLAGREEIVPIRRERTETARRLWPHALTYGRLFANVPFVRMVAITGSLAMNNVGERVDIDYLLVTRNGRLWLSRALVVAIVRLAASQGFALCPNYIVTERALHFPDQNLYTAHELVQMIPLSGIDTYRHIRQQNNWANTFLPNAVGPPRNLINGRRRRQRHLRHLAELPLRTPIGQWLEQWEMQRKIRKFQRQQPGSESAFAADWCKGHFDTHYHRTIAAYQKRVHQAPDKEQL